jgi:ATP-dependent Clp protease, protease subunit
MKVSNRNPKTPPLKVKALLSADRLKAEQTIHWLGGVNNDNYYEVMTEIKKRLTENVDSEINLVITSPGGSSGIAMSFYDTIKLVYKPKLCTIGAGDVDSSGIIIFLAGERRLLTPNTTMLLHLAGRTYDTSKRYTTTEAAAMLKEDQLKDQQYACLVAAATGNKLMPNEVLDLMAKNTVLTPHEAVEMGLAHGILE